MLTAAEARLLKGLAPEEHRKGRVATVHRERAKEALGELERRGLITLGACRTGIVPDPDVWWATITEAGRAALAAHNT